MKNYSIQAIFGSLSSKNPIIMGKNSKDALLNYFKNEEKKVGIVNDKDNINYSVVECDEEGRLHYDRRKWQYYCVKLIN